MRKIILAAFVLISIVAVSAQDNGFLIRVNQNVNLRLGPSIEAQRWGSAGPGDVLHVIGASNGWYQILLDGRYAGQIVWLASWLDLTRLDTPPPQSVIPPAPVPRLPAFDFFEIYQASLPSVVILETNSSGGTGFLIDRHGHVVTNAHVIGYQRFVRVKFVDGSSTRGAVIGFNRDLDLAVVRVGLSCERLQPLAFFESGRLDVGQPVLSIGGPASLSWDADTGHISALGVDATLVNSGVHRNLIQSDMRGLPGYSGGPLLDARGRVIGVVVGGGPDNTLSIPSAQAQPAVMDIIGEPPLPIEIPGRRVDRAIVDRFGLGRYADGILVTSFADGPIIEQHGLYAHYETGESPLMDAYYDTEYRIKYIYHANIIYGLDGFAVSSLAELNRRIREACPGVALNLNVFEILIAHRVYETRTSFADAQELRDFIRGGNAIPLGALSGAEANIEGFRLPLSKWDNLDPDIETIILVGIDETPVKTASDISDLVLDRLGQDVTLRLLALTSSMREKIVPISAPAYP